MKKLLAALMLVVSMASYADVSQEHFRVITGRRAVKMFQRAKKIERPKQCRKAKWGNVDVRMSGLGSRGICRYEPRKGTVCVIRWDTYREGPESGMEYQDLYYKLSSDSCVL